MNIVIVSGTNRQGSMSKKISDKLQQEYASLGIEASILDLADLPADIFTTTIYSEKPASFTSFHDAILQANGLVMVVPEYNGSYPGILKYFIDLWQYPQAFENRCVAYVGLSAGPWGALRSVEHLQGVFGYRNAWQFNERVFINNIYARWQNGDLQPLAGEKYSINDLLSSQCRNFVDFCKKHN